MTTFTAYATIKPKAKLQQWQYEPAALKDSEIEVKIIHNSFCHSDICMKDNDIRVNKFPLVSGHEVVSIVTEVGKNVTNLQKALKIA